MMFLLFSALEQEVDNLFYAFTNNIHALNKSAPANITDKAQPQALMKSIFATRDSHSKYIDDIQKSIQSAPSLSTADQSWHILNVRHKQFKDNWEKETTKFNQQYKASIAQLQGQNPPANQDPVGEAQNMQQQLENALKQLQEMQTANNQLQATNTQQQTQIDTLQTQVGTLQTRLIDKTEEASANNTKYLEEKHKVDIVKVKLGNFIDNHDGINDQDQLVEMLGDLQHAENAA